MTPRPPNDLLLRVFVGVGVAGLLACAAISACAIAPPRSSEPPVRAAARAYVLELAEGVRVADIACASVALERKDFAIAERCGASYQRARHALLAAEAALDAGSASSATCALLPADVALRELAGAVGAELPPVVADALTMAEAIARLAPCDPTRKDPSP